MIFQNLIIPYDYIIIIISFIFIIFSFWKGFIQSLLGFLTWLGSIIITIYSYSILATFVSKQLLKIDLFKNYELIANVIGTIIAIPLIFLISLFILKKIRKFLSNDLDQQILGIILDKSLGLIYGLIFSYIIFATLLYGIEKINFFKLFYIWVLENSYILQKINNTNIAIINYFRCNLNNKICFRFNFICMSK